MIEGDPGHVAYVTAVRADGSIDVASYDGGDETFYPEPATRRYNRFIYFDNTSAATDSSQWLVKTRNTGSGRVEVHQVTAASGWRTGTSAATRFSTADRSNGWFQMVGKDLWFIKTRNTGSGRVEVHQVTAASGWRTGTSAATRFSTADRSNGWFQMVGKDLWFIKTRNTGSGRVEVHQVTAASGWRTGTSAATRFSTADRSNGWFQMVGKDLWFIKTRNTGSGRVEVHQVTAASGWRTGTSAATRFSTADRSNGWFQMVGKDLWFIKTRNTGSGRVEVHQVTAASGWRTGTSAATRFSTADRSNGWFQMIGSG